MLMKINDETIPYFHFLEDIAMGDDRDYTLLLEDMHSIDFYSLVPNDDNREEDGKQLRKRFLKSGANKPLSLCSDDPCSVLEMLIGLAFRIENDLCDSPSEKSVKECFWILISNLGLTWCDNYSYHEEGGKEDILHKIQILLDRKYHRTGKGGLFPLKHSTKDQRQVEIWYQMAEYLLENY